MSRKGDLESALKNVQDFHDADVSRGAARDEGERRKDRKRDRSRSAERDHKKHKKKEKHHKRKERKDKHRSSHDRHKERRKHSRHGSPSSSDASDSPRGGRRVPAVAEIDRGRKSVAACQRLLMTFPAVRSDLRAILAQVDSGAGVSVAGVPDDTLRSHLETLLTCLGLASRGAGKPFKLPRGAPAPALSSWQLLSPVLSGQLPLPSTLPPDPLAPPPDVPANAKAKAAVRPKDDMPDVVLGDSSGDDAPPATRPRTAPTARPAAPTDAGARAAARAEEPVGPEPPRAVRGPAMPTPEQLAAAQAAAHAAAEDEQVGPEVPLDLEETDDARVAEVRRIMGVLAQAPKGPDGQPRAEAMAYEVVGVERGASAAQVRRRYMRSSLLVHPDKCDHPEARAAFQALSKVAAQLQDAEGRAVVEGAVEDQEMWELAKTVAAQQERAGAWERVRGGGGTPGAGLTGPELPQARDTWMTDLPALPTRAAGAEGITSKTAFAQNSREVGDRSGWLTVGGAAPAAPPGPAPASLPRGAYVSSAALRGEPEAKAPAASGGAATARQSLLERHQEELKKQKKSRKEAEKKEERGGKAAGESWKGVHPWRPFDREKDLEAPRQGAVLDKGKVQEGFLSRFRSAGS